jgi:hypothetical protein
MSSNDSNNAGPPPLLISDLGLASASTFITGVVRSYLLYGVSPTTLFIASDSNVVISAGNNVQVQLRDDNAFTVQSVDAGSNVTDVVDIRFDTATTGTVVATDNPLFISSASNVHINELTIGSNSFGTLIGTSLEAMTITSEVNFANSISVAGHLRIEDITVDTLTASTMNVINNLTVGRNVISSGIVSGRDVAVFKPTASNINGYNQVGYGLHINDQDQLEIIKYVQGGSSNTSGASTQRIAVFGHQDQAQGLTDTSSYFVFDTLNGISTINGTAGAAGAGSGPRYWLLNNSTGNIYNNSAYVGIGTSNPQYLLDVSGPIRSTQTVLAKNFLVVSDARAKKNVRAMRPRRCLEKVSKLRPCNYVYRDDPSGELARAGFIAQQVRCVVPEAVRVSAADRSLSLDTHTIVPYLVGAVQELAELVAARSSHKKKRGGLRRLSASLAAKSRKS